MNKIKGLLLISISVFFITSCSLKTNKLDNATIYTTIYPVKYIMESLYGENSTITSIYPNGVNLNEYELTEKQLDNYASGDLFVYVGVGNEKEIAKSLVNKNNKLLIIDATYGLSSNNYKELWLAPNNFLMMLKNVKNSLNEYLDNSIKEEEVTKKYDEIYTKVSWLDAEFRSIAKQAEENGKSTLVTSSHTFDFLTGYGFNVICLQDIESSGSASAVSDIKSKFKGTTYTNIIKLNSEEESELVKELVNKYKAKVTNINDLVTNEDSASDYVTIQYENISIIRDLLK
jgi:zinc transport system substrate-binding protein